MKASATWDIVIALCTRPARLLRWPTFPCNRPWRARCRARCPPDRGKYYHPRPPLPLARPTRALRGFVRPCRGRPPEKCRRRWLRQGLLRSLSVKPCYIWRGSFFSWHPSGSQSANVRVFLTAEVGKVKLKRGRLAYRARTEFFPSHKCGVRKPTGTPHLCGRECPRINLACALW